MDTKSQRVQPEHFLLIKTSFQNIFKSMSFLFSSIFLLLFARPTFSPSSSESATLFLYSFMMMMIPQQFLFIFLRLLSFLSQTLLDEQRERGKSVRMNRKAIRQISCKFTRHQENSLQSTITRQRKK